MKSTPDINLLMKKFMNVEPFIEFEEPKTESTQEQLYGLAQMYALKGYREYMVNSYRIAIKNAAMSSDNEIMGAFFKGRVLTLKELLNKSKKAYEEYERITKLNGASISKKIVV